MVTLNRSHKRVDVEQPEVKGKGKERALEPPVSVSEVQFSEGESSKGKGKTRVIVTELEQGASSGSPDIDNGTLGMQALRATEDERRAERRRSRMLSDGHPDRCECEICQEASTCPTVASPDSDELKPITNR